MAETEPEGADPITQAKAWLDSGRCPRCGGMLYDLGSILYCPGEDQHPGGLLIRDTIFHTNEVRVHDKRGPSLRKSDP